MAVSQFPRTGAIADASDEDVVVPVHICLRNHMLSSRLCLALAFVVGLVWPNTIQPASSQGLQLEWSQQTEIPDALGVASPFVGVHKAKAADGQETEYLLLAGGANFPKPVWESDKQWHKAIYVATLQQGELVWRDAGLLDRAVAYGASVSTDEGVVCIGGNDSQESFAECFIMRWDPVKEAIVREALPALPQPLAFGSATRIGQRIYLCGGQHGGSLETASNQLWSLDLSQRGSDQDFHWQQLADCPGPTRALNLTIAQHDGFEDCVYVISGRRQADQEVEFLTDSWRYIPSKQQWKRCADLPHCMMAGVGIAYGQSHVFVLSGADGSLFGRAEELKDAHPGFPKRSFAYHTITDTWIPAGETPLNQVTAQAVQMGGRILVPSGEIRPRVRTPQVMQVTVPDTTPAFGTINYIVLFLYLASMVGVGVYFAAKNKNTEDFFRGGRHIPWWAAGCSIFATMLSSLTFTGLPSKTFAQDCVYAIGNFMIPLVAIVAAYVALPFFRRIDSSSAYEYLERRFNVSVRRFASLSFTLFHAFRMAVVMSLTGLALAVATPMTPTQSVLLMGVLSILYCTMGGVEAVIWTDTIQTVVLLGGAVIAIALLISGTDGGFNGYWDTASSAGKFNLANWTADPTSARIALWVVIVGGLGQNLSSYTADQAVVQRYMTTPSETLARRSIWTNAVMAIPATLLFFGIGTALFAFYQSHPERLDPSITTDQIFPLFIAREMPVGLAGLIVAGIFAAAQSTVSTSMNSTATTLVTDFLRPMKVCKSEKGYLNAARLVTLLMGVLGTAIGLLFVDPSIKSLFDTSIQVIGLFMGVLGGLFLLGALSRTANGSGALVGAVGGALVMFGLWNYTSVNGYLYTTAGISSCAIIGWLASKVIGTPPVAVDGLTIYKRQ